MMKGIKTFPIVLTSEFHKQIKDAAAKEHLSLNKYFIQAVIEKLGREDNGQ